MEYYAFHRDKQDRIKPGETLKSLFDTQGIISVQMKKLKAAFSAQQV